MVAGGPGDVASSRAGTRPPPSNFRAVAAPGRDAVPRAGRRPHHARFARTIRTVRGDAANLGTHSVRWGAAAALLRAGAPRPLVTQALRHASARSEESDVLE